jgi:hypothetical protein
MLIRLFARPRFYADRADSSAGDNFVVCDLGGDESFRLAQKKHIQDAGARVYLDDANGCKRSSREQ